MNEHIEHITINEEAIRNIQNFKMSKILSALDQNTPSDDSINYKPLYYGMFQGITAIIKNTRTYEETIDALKQLQNEAENAYIEQA